MISRTLGDSFCATVRAHAKRPALEVAGRCLSYEELHLLTASFSRTLDFHAKSRGPALTAVFAYRSVTAFAGVLAALWRGHGYVPLNRTFPVDRTRGMLMRSGCTSVIVDEHS